MNKRSPIWRVLADLETLCVVLLGVFILLIGGTLLMAAFLGLILGASS